MYNYQRGVETLLKGRKIIINSKYCPKGSVFDKQIEYENK